MKSGFNAFMDKLIDYAGLFPPAKLEMDAAVRNYARYRDSKYNWILSHFICPAARLPELDAYFPELFDTDRLLPISALIRRAESQDNYFENIESDVKEIAAFLDAHENQATVNILECCFPPDIYHDLTALSVSAFLNRFADIVNTSRIPAVTSFFEMDLKMIRADSLKIVAEMMAEFNNRGHLKQESGGCERVGLKLRCGGETAQVFPSSRQVADVLVSCYKNAVPFKATAGLHHPLHHHNEGVHTRMHGFLNIFGAALLLHEYGWKSEQVQQMVEDETAANFRFQDNKFAWREWEITGEKIRKIRENTVISFGSCSFEEPLEDFHTLGLFGPD